MRIEEKEALLKKFAGESEEGKQAEATSENAATAANAENPGESEGSITGEAQVKPSFIDTHGHFDDPSFDADRDELLEAMHDFGVLNIVNCATDVKSCKSTLKLMKRYPWLYGAMGIHPHEVKGIDEDAISAVYTFAEENERVCAIGEIGLDYHYDFSPRDEQQDWFIEQIELAKELELPIIVHSREAAKDTMDIIRDYEAERVGGVIHAYSGDLEMAEEYVRMGFYLGIGGMVTFPKVKKLIRVVEGIPLEHLLLETDSPYMTPVPNRGKRNDSRQIVHVAAKIAEIKGISVQKVCEVTTQNAKRLFGIK